MQDNNSIDPRVMINSRYISQIYREIEMAMHSSYLALIDCLLNTVFTPIDKYDRNRESDIFTLRHNIVPDDAFLLSVPPTWLELLFVLATKCEDQMAEFGQNMTSYWFWLIVDSMFSFPVTNGRFDSACTQHVQNTLNDIQSHKISLLGDKPEFAEKELLAQTMEILNEFIAKNR